MSGARELLLADTPAAWLDEAVRQRDLLVIDHANCEKKAASTALSLMFTYAEDERLTLQLSRLAREELRHFEQVRKVARDLGVRFTRLGPGRYAEQLRRTVRKNEPGRQLDVLLCGALIEARSCERFHALVPVIGEPLGSFFAGLEAAESRHQSLYLDLARSHAERSGEDWSVRLRQLQAVESELITTPDPVFRFHSGVPLAH
ncbi:MAG: tRNA-(ms[2]io[6]A)-hydroxylase [Gammaproteobacteria bacterium]